MLLMDHDPLCIMHHPHYPKHPLERCEYCDMIARVREDERDKLFPQRWGRAEQLEKARVNGWHAGWNAAKDEFYAAALRNAIEAVVAIDPLMPCGCTYEAIAAIEALGEKQ